MRGELEQYKVLREQCMLQGAIAYGYEIFSAIDKRKIKNTNGLLNKIRKDAEQFAELLSENLRNELLILGVKFFE